MRSPLSNRSRYVVICVLTSLTVCSSASAELVCHWPLDEDFANLEDPNFDGYLDARAIVDFTEVLPNEDGTGPLQEFAAQFTGAGSFVQTDYPGIGGNQARTVTAWIKTTAIGTNDILGYGVPTNSLKWHFRLNPTAANGVLGAIRTEYQGGQNVGTTAINDGRWHHVAAVFPEGATIGADILHYVDGVLEGRTGNGALVVTTNIDDPAYTLTIGLSRQSATSLRWFNGQIADVRIFDHGLSPQNIFEVMNDEDLTDPVPCDDLSLTCQTVEDENRVEATVTLEPEDCSCPSVVASVNGEERGSRAVIAGSVEWSRDFLCSGFPGEQVTLTITCPDSDASASCDLECPERQGLVAHWPFDEGDGDQFEDVAGNFDGFLPPTSTIRWVEGPPTQDFAVEFTGTNSWIETDYRGIGGANPRTITAWIKSTMPGTLNNGIVAWGQDASTRKWHIRLNNNAANGTIGALRVEVNGGFAVGSTPLNDGEWHHVAIVLPERATTTADALHYVDGQLDPKSGTLDLRIDTNNGDGGLPVQMGRRTNGNGTSNYFPGAVADVRIYDGALEDEEILEIATGGQCFVRRSLSSFQYAGGDTIVVTLTTLNTVVGTVLTEEIPKGWQVSNVSGGGQVNGSEVTWTLTKSGQVSYELVSPGNVCEEVLLRGEFRGPDCSGEVVGHSALDCLSRCEDVLESGGVHGFLVIGPIAAGRLTNGGGQCADVGPEGDLSTNDYLASAAGLGEVDVMANVGDEIVPDFGGLAAGAGVASSPNSAINPRRDEGVLTVWSADADPQGRVDFNDADNVGDPLDDYIIYGLVYLENHNDDELPVVLEVGSDDGVKVLLNGENVWFNGTCRGVAGYGAGDRIFLDGIVNPALEPGLNTLLIAVVERGGGTGLRVVVRDLADAPLTDGSVSSCLRSEEDDPEPPRRLFRRGDLDANQTINLTDGIFLLNYLFLSGRAPSCFDAGDVDDGGSLNLSDAIFLLNHLFLGGPSPSEPFDNCGVDPTEDNAACETATCAVP